MKILIDRRLFAQTLAEVAPFAPTKAPVAILKYAKITTKGDRMKIEANDTECSMVKYIETLECDEDGTFLIDVTDLKNFIAKIKGDTIEIQVYDNTVHLKHSSGNAEFQTQNASIFPCFEIPSEDVTEVCLDSRMIADAITKAKSFVMTDKLRPQMTAIYAYIKDGEFGYCATDTRKLIHGHSPYPADNDIEWLIMPSVFSALVNACKTADKVRISITPKFVSYRIGQTIIHSAQAAGKFPNFKRVIPSEWNMELAVDKSELSEALGRISLFCDASECVKIDVTRMDMTLSVDNLDYMKKSVESLTHNGCNGEIEIGANVNNLLNCVSVFNSNDILIRMTDHTRPIVFHSPDNDGIVALSMPMTIVTA